MKILFQAIMAAILIAISFYVGKGLALQKDPPEVTVDIARDSDLIFCKEESWQVDLAQSSLTVAMYRYAVCVMDQNKLK